VFHGRVAGLDAGTGSAFSLLPAQNATGNWIKIVQRVPVRVELDPKELAAHPLRVGLSMTADIDIHPGEQAQALAAPAPAAAGYDADAARAEARIAELLAETAEPPSGTTGTAHPRRHRPHPNRPAPVTNP
jgi:membrane fusion protein (multidrug efflux system)